MPREVTVSIPASTANLGPGFDCLGLALNLRNRVTFFESRQNLAVKVSGEGRSRIPTDESNWAVQAAARLFDVVGRRPAGLGVIQENQIPVGSGLGSSAAAVLGGLLAANALVDGGLSNADLLSLATELEGHPDNVAPALFGGLTLVTYDEGRHLVERIPLPAMMVVVVVPDYRLPTIAARAALPAEVPLADAIFNAGRTALLVRALETANYDKLGLAMQDRLHQPYRMALVPGLEAVFRAARRAGAASVALSGAGPGVVALGPSGHEAIAEAMKAAFSAAGLSSRSWLLPVDQQGSYVV